MKPFLVLLSFRRMTGPALTNFRVRARTFLGVMISNCSILCCCCCCCCCSALAWSVSDNFCQKQTNLKGNKMPAGADFIQSTTVMICSSTPDNIDCSNVLVKVSIWLPLSFCLRIDCFFFISSIDCCSLLFLAIYDSLITVLRFLLCIPPVEETSRTYMSQ